MQFRSTTDEMLAARFDPEPYRCGGKSGYELRHQSSDIVVCPDPIFDPRPECIPTRDPYPWRVEVIDRADMDLRAARDGERLSDPAWTTFWDASTERLVFDPRPEYASPEPNPILVMFRTGRDRYQIPAFIETMEAGGVDVMGWTPAQIDHARKVLTRLANVYKEDQNAVH